jgi:acetaldehyde dehydrogenase
VNGAEVTGHNDISMITCGGQAAVPVLHAVTRDHPVEYIEVVTTAASPSLGPATRLNLDEYTATTEDAVRHFTGVRQVKAMANVSSARPAAPFRVAMTMVGAGLVPDTIRAITEVTAERMRDYVPGYQVTACVVDDDRAFVAVEVTGGGRLPRYAGNLDIINSAAVHVAEQYAAASAEAVKA